MPTGKAQPSDNEPAGPNSDLLCQTLASKPSKRHNISSIAHVSEGTPTSANPPQDNDHVDAADRDRVRKNVEVVLDAYVRVDQDSALRSAARRLSDINDALADIKTSPRKELHSRPTAPLFLNGDGTPMRRVAPLRDVARVVRVKHKAPGGTGQLSESRLAYLDVAAVLSHLQRRHADVLLAAAVLRLRMSGYTAAIGVADRILKSATRTKRMEAREIERLRANRVVAAREREALVRSRALKSVVQTNVYKDAVAFFDLECLRRGDAAYARIMDFGGRRRRKS